MRQKRLIAGLNNGQKIRVMVDGVGFYTTVGETAKICTTKHRAAVQVALQNLAYHRGMDAVRNTPEKHTGFGFNYNYTADGKEQVVVPVQVDMIIDGE